MGHLDTIEKAAQKLIALCQKEKQTKTDKKKDARNTCRDLGKH